ncbi:hypothetical protein [Maritimibacter sp. UBA3975]|uniref:hypothetical protein n=1 Tax=Maritimibacter sp. UBA3975 TaxID=1946833 RepID=UPI000C0B11A1|nr:hypothetical protein [Maritimibacter sp. UBA3975]MAM60376.1 hypothetical protein [Maritimibacter sp.]|tara:strand:- start:3280 stop:3804 length:525 start_codon:yes stop_codon:yes gene_type:complete
MKFNFAGMAAAAIVAATGASAAPQDTINEIVQGLAGEGFTRVEIMNRPNSIKIEAHGPNGSVERVYDGNGAVLRERVRAGDFGMSTGARERDRSGDDRRMTAGRSDDDGPGHDRYDDGPDHDRYDDHGNDDHERSARNESAERNQAERHDQSRDRDHERDHDSDREHRGGHDDD